MRLTPILIALLSACLLFGARPTKTVLENDDVRVLDALPDAHVKSAMHEHKANRVMIYLAAGEQELAYADGKKTTIKFSKNQALWSPHAGMHTSEMMSAAPVEVIELELKKPGAGKTVSKTLDPLKVDPKHYKLEMENDQVRVTRVRFGVNEGAPMHEHVLSRVVVYLTDARTKVTAADGTVTESSYKAGDVVYGGAAKHSEVNVSGHPIEIVVTELKY